MGDVSNSITVEELNARESIDTESLKRSISGISDRKDQEFINLESRLMGRIKNLEQMIKGSSSQGSEEIDLIQPYERDISMDPSRNVDKMTGASLSEHNEHISHLSNHELHQLKSVHERDHRAKPHSIMDESLGEILDKTINLLVHSQDGYSKKIIEAELMEDIHSTDTGYYNRLKVYLIAMVLYIRDERNIIYMGFFMIFLSVLIYFINIITTA